MGAGMGTVGVLGGPDGGSTVRKAMPASASPHVHPNHSNTMTESPSSHTPLAYPSVVVFIYFNSMALVQARDFLNCTMVNILQNLRFKYTPGNRMTRESDHMSKRYYTSRLIFGPI